MSSKSRWYARRCARTISRSIPKASNERLMKHADVLWEAGTTSRDIKAKFELIDALVSVQMELERRGLKHPTMEGIPRFLERDTMISS